jgi:hypothetical protein
MSKDEMVKVTDESVIVDLEKEVIDGPPPGMQKMYLSGPMTGVPEWNHPLFHRVAAEFRLGGFEVCNPAEFFDGDTTKERKDYMREAIKYLLEADTVVLLPGWDKSEGARMEAKIATELDLIIVEYVDNEDSAQEFHRYIGSLTPVDEDGNPIEVEANLGSLTPVEVEAEEEAK